MTDVFREGNVENAVVRYQLSAVSFDLPRPRMKCRRLGSPITRQGESRELVCRFRFRRVGLLGGKIKRFLGSEHGKVALGSFRLAAQRAPPQNLDSAVLRGLYRERHFLQQPDKRG